MRIVSNHCYGANLYKSINMNYNSPFIWSLILPNDFLKLNSDLKHYIESKPLVVSNSESINDVDNLNLYKEKSGLKDIGNYPVVKLDDIYIHFIHNNKEHNNNVFDKFSKRV